MKPFLSFFFCFLFFVFLIVCTRCAVLLRAAQERGAYLAAACRPPRYHADERMVRRSLHPRRTFHLLRLAQHIRAYCHVLLLHGCCHGTPVPEVHLVEEIPHHLPNGKLAFSSSPYPSSPPHFHYLYATHHRSSLDNNNNNSI